MNRGTILHEMKEMQEHNLSCYSKDYQCRTPKEEYEKEWNEAKEKFLLITRMLDELPYKVFDHGNGTMDKIRIFFGTVAGYETGTTKTEDPHPYITQVDFLIDDGAPGFSNNLRCLFGIDHQLGIAYFLSGDHDKQRHIRYEEGKGDLVKITVMNNIILSIEWAEPEPYVKKDKPYWAEIKADYDELESLEPSDDIVKCICIDTWKTGDYEEEGHVIAKVILTKSGDCGVVYIDNVARGNSQVDEVIQEVLRQIKP